MDLDEFYDAILSQTQGKWVDFEGLVASAYRAVLSPGDTALDIGAHKGSHTFQMLESVAPSGRVIAFEAAPMMVSEIHSTLDLYYSQLRPLLTLHNCAVLDRAGNATFFFTPNTPGLSSLRNRGDVGAGSVQPFEVQIRTVDEIVGESDNIRFIKCDIEGAEYHAFLGARNTIARCRPVVCFEHNWTGPKHFGYQPVDFSQFWEGLDYAVFDLFGNPQPPSWPATARIWDFLAAPREYDVSHVFQAAAERLYPGVRYPIPSSRQGETGSA
ncbi:MAG: FkbM family methyltransferase [Bryobacteraceae bacterium]|nr:FkbM family methyltransferase [Bryobacteraceae bacterium]